MFSFNLLSYNEVNGWISTFYSLFLLIDDILGFYVKVFGVLALLFVDLAVGLRTLKLILLTSSFYLFYYLCVALLLLTLFLSVTPYKNESLCDLVYPN